MFLTNQNAEIVACTMYIISGINKWRKKLSISWSLHHRKMLGPWRSCPLWKVSTAGILFLIRDAYLIGSIHCGKHPLFGVPLWFPHLACHKFYLIWWRKLLINGIWYSGEIQVWDTGREDETVIATSGMGSDSHREPVTKVTININLYARCPKTSCLV